MEADLHLEPAANESEITHRLHRVMAEGRIGIEVLHTAQTEQPVPIEFVAVTATELHKAIRDKRKVAG
jgi:hypothetical protein